MMLFSVIIRYQYVFVVSWPGLYYTFKPICIYFAYKGRSLFFFTLEQYIYFSLCVQIYIYFTSLGPIYFSVYKFGSQTKPSLDLELNDPSKTKLHKFKGHIMMPDKWGSIFLGLINTLAHKLKWLFITNLNIYSQHQIIIYFTKI